MIYFTKSLHFLLVSLLLTFACQRAEKVNTNETDGDLKKEITVGHFEKVIAKMQDGQIEFVADVDKMKKIWAKVINDNSPLNLSFNDISIVEVNGLHFLLGIDDESKAKSIIKLVQDGENFYECKYTLKTPGGSGRTVTCSGCESTGPGSAGECMPQVDPEEGWYCTDCSEGTCTKTETLTIGGGVTG